MSSGNASNSVTLTGYTMKRSLTVHGSAPSSESGVKSRTRSTVADFEFFFEEFKQMKEAIAARGADVQPDEEEEEEEEEKTKKDGEQEAEWLKQVGLKTFVSDFEADRDIDLHDVEYESSKLRLTIAQRAAVRRRVDTLNATVRRRRRKSPVCEDGTAKTLVDVFNTVQLTPKKEGIKLPFSEQAPQFPPSVSPSVLGVTYISDLSMDDIVRIRRLAFLELTTILETFDVPVKVRKTPKRKYKETGIFGVPLTKLVERDKQLDSKAKTPLFFQEIIVFLEENGIKEEGILRIPGSSARIKVVIRELEETFYNQDFSWENKRTNDVATLLKQFLRDLPYPLLTYEYLHLFASVDAIVDAEKKEEALNLLVLLLPDCHRATLRLLLKFLNNLVEHEAQNKMSINNVSMIMAPNLFLSRQRNNQTKESDLQMAACTYSVMRMLIKLHDSLWIVPVDLLGQLRELNKTEKRKPRGGKKKRSTDAALLSPTRRVSDDLPTPDQLPPMSRESQERLKNIIRVQAPHFAKVSMAFELTPALTAGEIVSRFRKKSFDNTAEKEGAAKQHPVMVRRMSLKTIVEPLDTYHLFEIGGNIGERCLPHDSIVMAVLKGNPNAEWVIKQRELDF